MQFILIVTWELLTMHVIEKATLFTEVTIEECATVSGGNPVTSSSNSTSAVTIIINNPASNSTSTPGTGTGTTGTTGTGTTGTGTTGTGTTSSGLLLPLLDAVNNFVVIRI